MIWVVGSGGLLGREMVTYLESERRNVIFSGREVDITDSEVLDSYVKAKIKKEDPLQWIINCAAYTSVDRAEEDHNNCRKLNVDGPRNLGLLAENHGAKVIHFSTDFVFDGKPVSGTERAKRAYKEDDPIGPLNYYGLTKAQGEEALQESTSGSIILRTSWLYGKNGPNFVNTMLGRMKAESSLGVVSDQWGTPTWTSDLAKAVVEIIDSYSFPSGIFHFSGEGVTNWYEFALEIQRLGLKYGILNKKCIVKALTTGQYPTKACRPSWSLLDKSKVKTLLRSPILDWKENLEQYFRDIQFSELL